MEIGDKVIYNYDTATIVDITEQYIIIRLEDGDILRVKPEEIWK